MNATRPTMTLAGHPETGTMTVTPEAIRARVAASLKVIEIRQSVECAQIVRDAVAVAVADATAAGEDTTMAVAEYRRASAALACAQSTHAQAMDELQHARTHAPLPLSA